MKNNKKPQVKEVKVYQKRNNRDDKINSKTRYVDDFIIFNSENNESTEIINFFHKKPKKSK